ncbi:MAG: hypothetical protein AAB176_14890 [Pseudomonadota bacterium]
MTGRGYFHSPWPCEDGGPQRLQRAERGVGLGLAAGEVLQATRRRTLMSTMTVLGAPGEVYLMTHTALRAHIGLATTARVEMIDPVSLRTLHRSPRLQGGPMWPGGMAIHRNGDIYLVYGRHCHRLSRHCQPKACLQLPEHQPYNSFVVLDNGLLVTKNLSDSTTARLTVIDPDSLTPVAADLVCPEPSIARLSAQGDSVYVVGVRSIFRYHWNAALQSLQRDTDWQFDYIGHSGNSHGWDVVIDGAHAWFMDNGAHRYRFRMIGAGVRHTANRLIRVSLSNAADHQSLDVSGLAAGSVTNPPLIDVDRSIVVGYDSANAVLRAWRFDDRLRHLTPLWHKAPFGSASHMLLYPDSAELVVNDYRRYGEEVVVLDIESGQEKGRIRTCGLMQGVVFPSPGWARDFYWSSMGQLARVFVA